MQTPRFHFQNQRSTGSRQRRLTRRAAAWLPAFVLVFAFQLTQEALADIDRLLSEGASGGAWSSSPFVAAVGSGSCEDRTEANRQTDAFVAAFGELVRSFDRFPSSSRRLAIEVSDQLRELSDADRQRLCRALHQKKLSAEDVYEVTDQMRRSRSPQGCIGLATYRAILGVETVFLSIQAGTQGACDAASCYNPLSGPPRCQFACIAPGVFGGAAEIIATRRDISDKCANETHEDMMDAARANSDSLLSDVAASIGSALNFIGETVNSFASEFQLADTVQVAVAGFDGGPTRSSGEGGEQGRSSEGLVPRLGQLEGVLAVSSQQQRAFELAAIEARIEAAIVAGLAVNRLQLPRAQGGQLEQLRETVAGRIQAVAQVGLPTATALEAFRLGDRAFNERRFKDAYDRYVESYALLDPTRRASNDLEGGAR